jgi:dihydroorotate dehydrogenase (fumarate)
MIPLSNAAGTVKYIEQAEKLARAPVSEIVIGSYTLNPREGNPGNVYCSREGTVLNALGMPNPGAAYLRTYRNAFLALAKPIVVSVAGFNAQEYVNLAIAASWASAIEVNLGCPNVWTEQGQHRIGSFDLRYIQRVLEALADSIGTDTPLRIKLSPYSDPDLLGEVAQLLDSYDIDAIVASNTFPNGWLPRAVDTTYGGVSGAAMKAIILGQVLQFRSVCDIPVIAAGGIRSGVDLVNCESVGASGAQVASRYLDRGEDPDVFVDILAQALDLGA